MVEEFQQQNELRRDICVIGAGPAGLAAVKIVKDSPQYKAGLWTVTAFEARNRVGGIWYSFILLFSYSGNADSVLQAAGAGDG